MAHAVISYAGQMPYDDGEGSVDLFPFVPCLDVKVDSELFLKVWVQLNFEGGVNANARLERDGLTDNDASNAISRALLLYGVRRLELLVGDLLVAGALPPDQGEVWQLGTDQVPELLALAGDKRCSFQRTADGDLFCVAAARSDKSVTGRIDGRRAAPTTRAFCNRCALPNTDYACSHLRHVEVTSVLWPGGIADRILDGALCDLGRREVGKGGNCYAAGNACWQREVALEEHQAAPLSPLSLAESFDVLDVMWRLAFGPKKRLLSLGTTMVPAALVLGCTNRTEFESRVSALADLIDLLKIDDDLLPAGLTDADKIGSINRLERCLLSNLPAEQHEPLKKAIQTLRRVRQTRNAMQHSAVDGGFVKSLRALGINDAPPNWPGAWETLCSRAADALTIIRGELRRWIDTRDN